ncbi:MAG: HYR domain-containing protein [Saprospiraceae bacterium]
MNKLNSLNAQKAIFLLLLLCFSYQAQGQLRIRHLLGLLKPSICNSNPIIHCPPKFAACPSASLLPSNTGFATGEPGGPDCSFPIISFYDDTLNLGTCPGAIKLMRVWIATDPQNNLLNSSCTQIIELSDTIAPVISNCPANLTVSSGPNCKANVSWIAPNVSDNCGKLFLTVSHISGDAFPIGITTITYTASDLCNNISQCSFTITVIGNCCKNNPILTCPSNFSGCPTDSLVPSTTGNPIVMPGGPFCSSPIVKYTDSIISSGPCLGAIHLIRTWKAFDPFDSTLNASCKQEIELKDTQAPTISNVPSNITVSPGLDCKATVQWVLPIGNDQCGKPTLVSSHQPGSQFSEGTTIVVYTVTDVCGNTASASFQITVSTCCSNPPILQCPLNYSSCPGSSTDPNITGQAIATKSQIGCGTPILTYSDSVINFSCPGSKLIFRKWKATDPNNPLIFSSCTQYVELKDDSPPVFTSCPTNITVNTNTLDCKATVQWQVPQLTDNCSQTINLISNYTPGTAFPVGVTTIIYTANDGCNNTIQHSFTITVINTCCNGIPKIICPPDYKGCPAEHCGTNVSGTATGNPSDPTCPVPIISYRDSLLNVYSYCPNAKRFIRIWRAADPNDPKKYVVCNQLIELLDKIPPVWSYCPPDITVQAYGACEKIVYWTPPTAIDNCSSFVQITSNYTPGQTFPTGTTVVVYTAKDECGNYITHSFKINVIGSGLSLECPSDIVVERTDPNLPGAYVSWYTPKVTTCGNCKDSLKGFIYMGTYNGSQYFCSLTTATWNEANNYCKSIGANLAVINSQAENNYIASKLMGATAYIGLHDSNVEGLFEWVDNSNTNFINWYPGQPNNANGDQDYVEILPDGTWNDQYTNTYREFICEIPCYTLKQIEGPYSGSLFKCGTTKVSYVATQGNYKDTCSFNVTVKCSGNKYCDSKAQSCGSLWIKNVSLSNINNTTGPSNGYVYYPSPCGELKWGKSYNLCLTPGFSTIAYTVYWKVWIDYNGDGDFYDQDELVAYGNGSSTLCGNITLPWNCQCPMINTRMRVSMSYGSYPGNPCCSIGYGEVEDYCINISKNNLGPDKTNSISKPINPKELAESSYNNTDLLERDKEIGSSEINSIEILPNPANNYISILSTTKLVNSLHVYNYEGKQILQMNFTESAQLDISDWKDGIYLFVTETNNGIRNLKKISVMH